MNLRDDGLELHPAVLERVLIDRLRGIESRGVGRRLVGDPVLPALLKRLEFDPLRGATADRSAVRAVLFDKSPEANWSVAWHQDRTIAVRKRLETPGFGPWSRKSGLPHVEPPFSLLARMITVRVHLDDCGEENAPLRVARGSHKLGRVPAGEAAARAAEHEEILCLAAAGDVWVYSTPVLHASDRASAPGRRRVLQIDYSSDGLPNGLAWAGV